MIGLYILLGEFEAASLDTTILDVGECRLSVFYFIFSEYKEMFFICLASWENGKQYSSLSTQEIGVPE